MRAATWNAARSAAAAIVALSCGTAVAEAPPAAPPLAFNRFYDYDEATAALRELARRYPRFLQLTSIGKSVEGRELWLMTVHNPQTGPERSKSAMYIDANIHGNEVQGTETCLYTIQYLVTRYDQLARLRELVDERVFYIVPMVNPDGRAGWFEGPSTQHSSRSGRKPVDDDGDGRFDEDGLDDIDGDGEALLMWRRDPRGGFKRSHEDPRILVRVKPGEAGEFDLLGTEGIDNDGDGAINEDGPGGYDMNRNWPADWLPQPLQGGAGDYPLSLPETRAIAELILAHPNIAGVQAYHNAGGMILRGPGDRELGEYPGRDVRVYDELGQTGEGLLPFYRYMIQWRDLYAVHGGFVNWTYEELGIFSFTNELWNTGQYESKAREGLNFEDASAARLKWDDLLELEHQFVELKPARHPLYGDILLGGYRKTAGRVPPLFLLEELCHRNAMFTLYHAYEMPRVVLRPVEVERLGDGLHAVTVTLENSRTIPTRSAIAERDRLGTPDLLELEGAGLEVILAGRLTDRFRGRIARVAAEPGRLRLEGGVPGKGEVTYRFVVHGTGEATIRFTSEKGGVREARVAVPGA